MEVALRNKLLTYTVYTVNTVDTVDMVFTV